ncbi:Bug family tripartite tricarboxylate transporter substrate binding protein [Caldovatus aquaticus]|uniref:Tripartite tricarboxylate transporter substrate binding protein n=1 Tax=Caldovatus aquaticus TaxID=2865671 RepID=A0ABS7F2Z1_9PROT|nr:tripartite tricarboxylate transporter substrate binding protein [Caldovatus aquaticus]MBW8269971.1 tripartite tricarboxylate transporter substrate binding protein [Caldovatus aquaticus]
MASPRPAPSRRQVLCGLAAASLAALASGARAQGGAEAAAWPQRPVRVIVPFPGGSTPDIAARAVAQHFQQVFGQPFVPDNRAGGGGTIGTDAIAKATDGHTIGVSIGGPASTARILNPALPYDPATDLAPVSLLTRLPFVLVVHPSVPARSVAELVAHAKAHPGALNYGSVGAGTLGHLLMAELAARHGLEMTHVPYRSVPQAVTELVAGRIQAMFAASGAVLGQVREGTVRGLAVSSDTRFAAVPDLPTLREAGEPVEGAYGWIGLFAPPGTPPERVARLAAEAGAALAAPQTRRALEAAGFEVVGSDPLALRMLVAAEIGRWGPLIRRLGIRPES